MSLVYSVLMPSRGRPKKSLETYRKWSNTVSTQFILSLDQDDPFLSEYLDIYPDNFKLKPMPPGEGKWGRCFSDNFVIIVNNNRSAVDAINKAAEVSLGKVIVVVSDDTEPVDNWYTNLYQAFNGKTDWILKTQDGIQPYIITMPIMDQEYYKRFGYIYNPGYAHMFCDLELTCVADITGRKITSNLMFKHNHYSVTKEQPDQINKKADATWAQGEKLFLERYKRNFDLPKGFPIQDKGMINWLRRKIA